MQKKKPYSFVIYENEVSSQRAINALQGKTIEIADSQTPMCYYLFYVDKGYLLLTFRIFLIYLMKKLIFLSTILV